MRCGVDSVVEWPSACWRSACRRFDSCHRTALILPYPFPLYSRSIPVHTGKPGPRTHPRHECTVYPRTHGETSPSLFPMPIMRGLSPYTRGNPEPKGYEIEILGSIPVHTGKPSWVARATPSIGVYPRTHGETSRRDVYSKVVKGLSPYTRGNRVNEVTQDQYRGSIPVHTGKPKRS